MKSCNNLLQQADIRMRSHGLRQLGASPLQVVNRVVASYQQTCCKLIISTGLLQVVSTNCNKSANDKLMKLTSLLQFVDKLQQFCKIENLQQVCGVFDCVA